MMSIDPSSTCTGYAIWDNGELKKYNYIDLKKNKDSERRMFEMCTDILFLLNKYQPEMIYIEIPDGHSIKAHQMLGKILGVVYGWTIQNKCYYEEFKPVQWRSLIGIQQYRKQRDELKQLDIEYVKKNYNVVVPDDIADAICIGAGALIKYKQ